MRHSRDAGGACIYENQSGSNLPAAHAIIAGDGRVRGVVARAVAHSIDTASESHGVAATVVEAALGRWRMRRTPAGQASLLSKLRRFLPASAVDGSLRKQLVLRREASGHRWGRDRQYWAVQPDCVSPDAHAAVWLVCAPPDAGFTEDAALASQ